MNVTKLINQKHILVLSSAALVGAHLFYDYLQSGSIPYHNVLAREDMPAISNWWGLLTIPLLTWIAVTFIRKRIISYPEQAVTVLKGFLGALLYGIVMSLLWRTGMDHLMQYLIWLPLLLAFKWPVYRLEYLLGFVLGMFMTFGGVLPIGIGLFLLLGSWLIHQGIRRGIMWLVNRFTG